MKAFSFLQVLAQGAPRRVLLSPNSYEHLPPCIPPPPISSLLANDTFWEGLADNLIMSFVLTLPCSGLGAFAGRLFCLGVRRLICTRVARIH